MWYAIIAAVFLSVGIGLMIWALRERTKRHEAERAADKALAAEESMAILAKANAEAAGLLTNQVGRLEGQLEAQRKRLAEARKLLAEKAPMPVIKAWLDDEGKGGEL
jgi:uncharacterized protein HemX